MSQKIKDHRCRAANKWLDKLKTFKDEKCTIDDEDREWRKWIDADDAVDNIDDFYTVDYDASKIRTMSSSTK